MNMKAQNAVYWIWFSSFPFLKLRTRTELLSAFKGPEGVFRADVSELKRFRGVSEESARIIKGTGLDRSERIIGECEHHHITFLTTDDPGYPFRLKNIYSPPPVLYIKGKLPDIDDSAVISVIGTRRASQYGLRMGKKIAFEIQECGGTVVSLMTPGVDQAVAEGALLSGRPCIGVLGTAHENDRSPLTDRIIWSGAVISEYPPGTLQLRSFFRDRNRIAAGISIGTVVVEAPEKSGTRYFVNEALDQGKDIFAVPGNADSDNSMGTLDLLKTGARPAGSGWDVISDYTDMFEGLHPSLQKMPDEAPQENKTLAHETTAPDSEAENEWNRILSSLNEKQSALIALIEQGASGTDELIEGSGLTAPKVLAQLTLLEIKGLILRDLSGRIRLNKHF